jgi:hypothetical protein
VKNILVVPNSFVFILQGLLLHDFHNKTDVLIFRKNLSIKKDKKYSTK